jgi:hypothetical protein
MVATQKGNSSAHKLDSVKAYYHTVANHFPLARKPFFALVDFPIKTVLPRASGFESCQKFLLCFTVSDKITFSFFQTV